MSTQGSLVQDQDNSSIEQLLQSGFETIVQAFELKSTSFQQVISEQSKKITELQSKITVLNDQIAMLKQENSFYKKENERLSEQNLKFEKKLKNANKSKSMRKQLIEDQTFMNNYYNTNTDSMINANQEEQENEGPLTDRKQFATLNQLYSNKNHAKSYLKYNSPREPEVDTGIGKIETRVKALKTNLNSKNSSQINLHMRNKTVLGLGLNNKVGTLDFSNLKREKNARPNSVNRQIYSARTEEEYRTFPSQINNININNNGNSISLDSSMSLSRNCEVTNTFLNKCKIYLTPRTFEKIVNIFQDYKDGLITEGNVVTQTRNLIKENNDLLSLFDSLFSIN